MRDEDLFAYFGDLYIANEQVHPSQIVIIFIGISESDYESSDKEDNDSHDSSCENVTANEPNEDLPIDADINVSDEHSEELNEENEDKSNDQTPDLKRTNTWLWQNPFQTPETIRRRMNIKPETVDRNF